MKKGRRLAVESDYEDHRSNTVDHTNPKARVSGSGEPIEGGDDKVVSHSPPVADRGNRS